MHVGVIVVAKYLVLFSFTSEAIKGFVAKPSDRAAVVRELAESAGGRLESYYWMFGQHDGVGVLELPDSHTMAAFSLAVTGSGAFTHISEQDAILPADVAERVAALAQSTTISLDSDHHPVLSRPA
jgi:uncharacterized protein with GYD domain